MCVDLPIFHTYRAQTEDRYKYLILGLDHAHLFPDPVDRQGLWAPYAKRYPGLRWNTSRVTGKGILMGWTPENRPLPPFRNLEGTKNELGQCHLETLESHLRIQRDRSRRALKRSLSSFNYRWHYLSQTTLVLRRLKVKDNDLLSSILDNAAYTLYKPRWQKKTLQWITQAMGEKDDIHTKKPVISTMLDVIRANLDLETLWRRNKIQKGVTLSTRASPLR